MALYRAPAGSHPDFPAIDVLANVLGEAPSGRLHRAIVQKGLASATWGAAREMHDPGYLYFGASLGKEANLGAARERLVEIVEGVAKDKVRAEELERARATLLNSFERTQLDTGALVRSLSEYIAMGDWRLFYLYRDRLRKVTLADVQRVAERYLKPANRVLGEFIPHDQPDRAEIPPTPDLQAALAGYKGGESMRLGEAFDPSPKNIESKVQRKNLSNGIRAALLPKQTRGGRVVATLTLHWGDENSLTNRETACNFAGAMLLHGTRKRSRAELKQEFERLNAAVSLDRRRREHRGARREPDPGAAPGRRGAARAGVPARGVRGDEARGAHRRRSAAQRAYLARQRAARAPPATSTRPAIRTTPRPSTSASR